MHSCTADLHLVDFPGSFVWQKHLFISSSCSTADWVFFNLLIRDWSLDPSHHDNIQHWTFCNHSDDRGWIQVVKGKAGDEKYWFSDVKIELEREEYWLCWKPVSAGVTFISALCAFYVLVIFSALEFIGFFKCVCISCSSPGSQCLLQPSCL